MHLQVAIRDNDKKQNKKTRLLNQAIEIKKPGQASGESGSRSVRSGLVYVSFIPDTKNKIPELNVPLETVPPFGVHLPELHFCIWLWLVAFRRLMRSKVQ